MFWPPTNHLEEKCMVPIAVLSFCASPTIPLTVSV